MAFLRKRASNDNPFNAINTEHTSQGLNFPESELRAELERRGLPSTGTKTQLVKRLKSQNKWLLTRAGMYEVHYRKLADLEKATPKSEQVDFHLFPKLPNEMRHMIWRASLSESRVLSVSDERLFSDRLYFRKGDNQENPTALSVCRESRAIALEEYHLAFGTPNVYFNFERDILYFGSHWNESHNFINVGRSSLWDWDEVDREEEDDGEAARTPSNDVVSSIQAIQYLALHPDCWIHYTTRSFFPPEKAPNPLRDFEQFLNLRTLMLVHHDSDKKNTADLTSYTPGHIELEPSPEVTSDENTSDDNSSDLYGWRRREAIALRKTIEKLCFGPEEKKIEVVFGDAKRLLKIPGEDWEFSWGEPYVCVLNFCWRLIANFNGSILLQN